MCAVNSNYMCNNNTNIQYNDSIKGKCVFHLEDWGGYGIYFIMTK